MESRESNHMKQTIEGIRAQRNRRILNCLIKSLDGLWHHYDTDENGHVASGTLRKDGTHAYLSRLSYSEDSVLFEVQIGTLTEPADTFALRSMLQQHDLPTGTRLCQDMETGDVTIQSTAPFNGPKNAGWVARAAAKNLTLALDCALDRLLALGIKPSYKVA